MALSKEQILIALHAWVRQRPGLEFANYGELASYRSELTISEKNGRAVLDYCTGQYWPTEYRRAVCAVLASVLWDRKREDMPPRQFVVAGQYKFPTVHEAEAYAQTLLPNIASIEERYEGKSAGDWIRTSFRREFGRSIQQRWFD